MKQTKPWLRYVNADSIDDQSLELEGMKVRNGNGETLGTIDGLIVDRDSGRTYYVVVDAGGWFSTQHFLAPIGQVQLADNRDAMVLNLSKDQIKRFPGFDKGEFDKLTEADIKRINDQICGVFEPNRTYAADEPYSAAWNRPAYRQPHWWTAKVPTPPGRDESARAATRTGKGDVSPHFDGRAQPGDVLGVETGGERSYLGDAKEDENERRRENVEDVRPQRH